MHRILTSLTITITYLILLAGITLAESSLAENSVIRNRDGTSGRLSHLGEDIGTYSDPHGNHTVVTKPGTESPLGLRPHGEVENGNRSSFGTPLPPNNLTPAPVLPFNPNRALSPPPSPSSQSPASGTRRFGR